MSDPFGNTVASLTAGGTFAAGDVLGSFVVACSAPGACDPSNTCDFTFDMVDSYGDGWNGWTYDFVQNGIVVATETLATGSNATATIPLCDGIPVDVVVNTAGSYASEVSWTVIDPFGGVSAT